MRTASTKTTGRAKKIPAAINAPGKTLLKKTVVTERPVLSPEKRLEMIRMAAYYLAEKSGFNPEMTTQNWLSAEKQIDKILATY